MSPRKDRLPPRPAGMSRLELPTARSGEVPAVTVGPDDDWRLIDHENRIRALETSNVTRGERARARNEQVDHRFETIEARITEWASSTTRKSDFDDLIAARQSELDLVAKAREADEARREKERETWQTRRWGIVMALVAAAIGFGAKALSDWWVGSKPQNAPVWSEE